MFSFIHREIAARGAEEIAAIPFQWNIYRNRPQMRYTLASILIRKILYGVYPVGSYLPSLPELSERYGASLTTVRRTLALLEELGVTESFQGKGTLVCMKRKSPDLEKAEIREGLRLHRESLQFLRLTIRGGGPLYAGARIRRETGRAGGEAARDVGTGAQLSLF